MEHEKQKRYAFGWVAWGIGILILLSVVGFVLNSAGLFGHTVVERVVFKNSFQYKEARESELTTYEAQLAEINSKLADPNLDENERKTLEAQKASINVLRSAAERRQ
jgi:5-bromo-4-chloroindolyl phosphate hydrolysis protein